MSPAEELLVAILSSPELLLRVDSERLHLSGAVQLPPGASRDVLLQLLAELRGGTW